MPKIDESRAFVPVNIAILTVSDTRSLKEDKSGQLLEDLAMADGHRVVKRDVLRDEAPVIAERLRTYIADAAIDVVITTGGTGLTGRDVTPEAFKAVLEKEIEGFGELFRWVSYKTVGTSAMQSRALGGVAGGTYLFALPGSPGACKDAWNEILRFQLDVRHRPCNLVELMPRLQEHLKAAG
ncbi:MAG: molybdenum cofactor biosynthesis protein B [Kiloniellales bacterium]